MPAYLALFIATVSLLCCGCSTSTPKGALAPQHDCVILLHGLARTSGSMLPMAEALQAQGYQVVNVDYPSRQLPIAELAQTAIPAALSECRAGRMTNKAADKIHFVTHSLGGILLRQYLHSHKIPDLHRVVMLAPPNKGSEIVDHLKELPPFEWLNGPAGSELGTTASDLPQQLGPANFELGIIAGTRSINLLLSLYLPNPDDGKVSVESTKMEGMRDFIALPVSHPFIMKDQDTIAQAIYFLQQGQFKHEHSAARRP